MSEQKAKHGGARPGAGRPAGSKIYENGRKNSSSLSFRVPDDIKEAFGNMAEKAGLTRTELFCLLVKNARF